MAKDILPGGAADNIPKKDFDQDRLDEGTAHEKEHTENKQVASEIARDHLLEDPNYYKKLKAIESKKYFKKKLEKAQNLEKMSKSGMVAPKNEPTQLELFGKDKTPNLSPSPSNMKTLYHGTPKNIYDKIENEGFKLTSGKRGGPFGSNRTVQNQGIFLTDSSDVANFFGQNRTGQDNTDSTYGVHKVDADIGHNLDLTQKWPSSLRRIGQNLMQRIEGRKNIKRDDVWDLLDQPEFVNHIKDLGYHSAKFHESKSLETANKLPQSNTYIVFDPKRLSVSAKINKSEDYFKKKLEKAILNKSNNLEKMSRPRITFPKMGLDTRPDQNVQLLEEPQQVKLFGRKIADQQIKDYENKKGIKLKPENRTKEMKRLSGAATRGFSRNTLGINQSLDTRDISGALAGKARSKYEAPDEEYTQKIKDNADKYQEAKTKSFDDYDKWLKELPNYAPGSTEYYNHIAKRPKMPTAPRKPSKKKVETKDLSPEQIKARGQAVDSTIEHEALHGLLGQVERKYGSHVYGKVVKDLLNQYSPDTLKTLSNWVENRGYKRNRGSFNEELLTHARDLLVNAEKRKSFKNYLTRTIKDNPNDHYDKHIKNLKQGHQKSYEYAQNLTPEAFGEWIPNSENLKVAADKFGKSESYFKDLLNKNEDLSKGKRGDWQKEGHKITHKIDDDGVITIQAHHPKYGQSASAVLEPRTQHDGSTMYYPGWVGTEKWAQDKGLATGLLNYAESNLGLKLDSTIDLSAAGKAFASKYKRINKSEIIFIINDPEFYTLEKAIPKFVGEKHPEQPWIAAKHPNGVTMWHSDKQKAAKDDEILNNTSRIDHFTNTLPKRHQALFRGIINSIKKDPNRHFIPTEENGVQKLRARHIKSLLSGQDGVTLDSSNPDVLTITRHSHSQGKNQGLPPIKISFKGVSSGNVEKNERRAAFGTSNDVFRRLYKHVLQAGEGLLKKEIEKQASNTENSEIPGIEMDSNGIHNADGRNSYTTPRSTKTNLGENVMKNEILKPNSAFRDMMNKRKQAKETQRQADLKAFYDAKGQEVPEHLKTPQAPSALNYQDIKAEHKRNKGRFAVADAKEQKERLDAIFKPKTKKLSFNDIKKLATKKSV